MSKAMRKVTGSLAKSTCTVVFLNQLRSKIGVIDVLGHETPNPSPKTVMYVLLSDFFAIPFS